MNGTSLTPQEEKLKALQQLLPEAFAEGKIDWEKLKATLGEDINFSNERYVLNWAGKSDAFKVLQTPSTKTLIPAKDESVNFDETKNIFIEGENLEVLKVLQKSYFGKVKMIYIDPPYNTGNDSFIYPDKFAETKADYEKRVGDKDEDGYRTKEDMFKKNSKENGQYHSNWLNMMMPRLYLAKNLLRQDGVIFVSIDEHEYHNLILLFNEVFGEENNLGTIIWDKRNPKGDAKGVAIQHEYIILFAKNEESFKNNNDLVRPKKNANKILSKAGEIVKKNGLGETSNNEFKDWISKQDFSGGEKAYNKIDLDGNVYRTVSMAWPNKKVAPVEYFLPLIHPITKKECPIPERGWRNPPSTMTELLKNNLIIFGKDEFKQPERKYLLSENLSENLPSIIYNGKSDDVLLKKLGLNFENPKVIDVIKELLNVSTNSNDLILDFFAGSGTTAHAVMELNKDDGGNRKYICVQLAELCDEKSEAAKAGYATIAEISKERIRRASKKIEEELNERTKSLGQRIKKLEGELQTEETVQEIKNQQSLINNLQSQDLGFKVLKLSDSNFKQWQQIEGKDPIALAEQIKLFVDPVAQNATIENMVYEFLLKSGKDLNSKISLPNPSKGDAFYDVNEGELILILETVNSEIIENVIAKKPTKVIALDKLFKDNDQLKTNTVLQMKDAGIEFKTV